MKILILAAMDKELQLIKETLSKAGIETVNEISLIHGKENGHDVYAAKCGIGKVNAAINTLRLVNAINPDLVINSGVAGGAGVPVGTVLVADRVAYHDVWCGPGTEYGEADGYPLFFTPCAKTIEIARNLDSGCHIMTGLICTGDKFISTPEQVKFIRSKFPDVKAVDMESAAIAQVCHSTSTPFSIIRVVSDTPGEGENVSQYENFWDDAPKKTFGILKETIEHL